MEPEGEAQDMNASHRRVQGALVAACLAAVCCMAAPGAYAATYSGGSGTSGDPYQISTQQDLFDLANTANAADWHITVCTRDLGTMD